MFSKKQHQLLARVNFPLYSVHCLTERHILVAGGGGGAKTGIPNVIEVYELINNGTTCRAESVLHYETGSEAIMNCSIHDAGKYYILFAGMEGSCHLYKIKHSITSEEKMVENKVDSPSGSVKRRKYNTLNSLDSEKSETPVSNEKRPDANANVIHTRLTFDIKHLDSFQTDFSSDPFQKLVRFSGISSLLVTAGSDGHIRAWKYPELSKLYDIEAHTDDVGDLDVCPQGKRIVSVSRDGHGKIFSTVNGSLISELEYDLPLNAKVKYTFRSCRFGIVDDKNELALYTSLNPSVRSKPPSQCYVCKWDATRFKMTKMVPAGTDVFSAMAINDNGRFIGLGTQTGCVKIYIAFSLQQIYNIDNAHGIFVTGLEFLPSKEESCRITGGHETSLISISVDNHVIVHHIPTRPTMSVLTLITLFILTLFLIFVIMDFLNL